LDRSILGLYSKVTLINPSIDRYNRTLATVTNSNGVNVNVKMISDGMAVWYKWQTGCSSYEQYELAAKSKNLGVWSDPNFVLPSDYKYPTA
jgi:endonuclease YncB( thermonuclease family)